MISRLRRAISRQLSNPSGFGGRVIAALMNRGNRKMNARAVDLLDVGPGTRVLDLGFGGGLAVGMLLERGAQVTGVERATDMIEAARARHPGATFLEGEVAALPLDDASVERVLTINTVYFWPDLPPALAEIRRVLEPGGVVLVGIRDGSVMTRVDPDVFTVRPPAEIVTALGEVGFVDARVESPSDQEVHFIIARSGPA